MEKKFTQHVCTLALLMFIGLSAKSQITLLQDYKNNTSAVIGVYQNITYREAGFSALTPIPNTNGKEFWTVSDRGVNIDCANANASATPVGTVGCLPSYDKMFAFPNFAPKIHRIKINGDSVQILQTITMKRPGGATATGLMNPTGLGSTSIEVISTATVSNCANFLANTAAKDIWGIDSEGIAVDNNGNFWISEEGGPTIWKLNPNGEVTKRYTPYGHLSNAQSQDVAIDTSFKYRKNNRGFECLSIAPNGKVYAIIQSPLLYPTQTVGDATQVHRMIEIDPATNTTKMFAYLNDGIIGTSGGNQIRLRDWKLGDMFAINNNEFLVIEAAARGTTDIKKIYKINITGATPVTSGLYGGLTLEALATASALTNNSIVPVTKTLFMDLLANSWPSALDKAEGLAILNDSTIAICNDNDFGQTCPLANGIAITTTNVSHVITYGLKGSNKLSNFQAININPVGIQTNAFNPLKTFNVNPNPANQSINISFDLNEDAVVTLKLTDLTGKNILTQEVQNYNKGENNYVISANLLDNGIYFIELSTNQIHTVKKVVIAH